MKIIDKDIDGIKKEEKRQNEKMYTRFFSLLYAAVSDGMGGFFRFMI